MHLNDDGAFFLSVARKKSLQVQGTEHLAYTLPKSVQRTVVRRWHGAAPSRKSRSASMYAYVCVCVCKYVYGTFTDWLARVCSLKLALASRRQTRTTNAWMRAPHAPARCRHHQREDCERTGHQVLNHVLFQVKSNIYIYIYMCMCVCICMCMYDCIYVHICICYVCIIRTSRDACWEGSNLTVQHMMTHTKQKF
jgi:hypothetical protein